VPAVPIDIEYPNKDIVLCVGRGVVTAAEVLELNEKIYTDVPGDVVVYQLLDLSRIERAEATSDEIRAIAKQDISGRNGFRDSS
jgi:hypothetical protein